MKIQEATIRSSVAGTGASIALTEVGLLYLMNPSTLNLIVHVSGILAGMLVLRPTKVINMLKYIFGFNLFGGFSNFSNNNRERRKKRRRKKYATIEW